MWFHWLNDENLSQNKHECIRATSHGNITDPEFEEVCSNFIDDSSWYHYWLYTLLSNNFSSVKWEYYLVKRYLKN